KAYTLVVKSTVPIGTSKRVEQVIKRTLIERDVNVQVFTASNPEFLREGMALRDSLYPDRIVVGAEQAAAVEAVRRLYRPILEQTFVPPSFVPRPEGYVLPPLITTDSTSAEMIKYSANAFLAVKISFINEIAGLCEKVGAHVTEVARGIGLDPRIGPRFLQAGLGWGGSCFPKDTSALLAIAEEYGYTMPIVKAARDVNFRQRYLIIEKLQRELKILRGKTIGILGLAFKPNTDDVRESPALALAGEFLQKGAMIRAYDPVAVPNARMVLNNRDMEYCNDPYTVALECDTIILATEWEEFRHLNWLKIKELMKVPIVLDARNFLNPGEIRKDGLEYLGIGR
ncbi:MAG: UDP-glucose/GDP-mannose dehydrogenase family protein, partial [Bacteroidetes bacterium]|nr:UDP-glucose/GDP-mannose dehydrogenase family protein [Bacteroidota bacterium]